MDCDDDKISQYKIRKTTQMNTCTEFLTYFWSHIRKEMFLCKCKIHDMYNTILKSQNS